VKNFISLSSFLWVAINLLIGLTFLLPIAIINWLLPIPAVSTACFFIVDHVYRFAVKVDSFWMQRVVGIELIIKGKPNTHRTPVVICNHQSWFDIPLIQEVITGKGPIVKFLIKRELAWVPIIGWICLALNFPRLRRSKATGDRKADFSIIQQASKSHGEDSGALLIFPEGTRFTKAKQTKQQSPYKHLLKPKIGGLKMIKDHASEGTMLVDITINYHQEEVRIWDCLHGNPKKITITLEHHPLDDIDDIAAWLNQRWYDKDRILSLS
jgi:1-acyl-sn-glycerol-3-phosphate acyltransferase